MHIVHCTLHIFFSRVLAQAFFYSSRRTPSVPGGMNNVQITMHNVQMFVRSVNEPSIFKERFARSHLWPSSLVFRRPCCCAEGEGTKQWRRLSTFFFVIQFSRIPRRVVTCVCSRRTWSSRERAHTIAHLMAGCQGGTKKNFIFFGGAFFVASGYAMRYFMRLRKTFFPLS